MVAVGRRREIDLIVERGGKVLALEVKLGGNVEERDVRHLTWLRAQLGDDVLDTLASPQGQRPTDVATASPLSRPPCLGLDPRRRRSSCHTHVIP